MFKNQKFFLEFRKKIDFQNLFNSKELKIYIFIGIINSIIGYIVGVFIFKLLYEASGILLVSIISNLVSIFFSFLNYKLFFFNKNFKNLLSEFFKFYFIYIMVFFISTIELYIFIKIFFINIYLAQAIIISSNIFFLFLSHFYLIFNKKSYRFEK